MKESFQTEKGFTLLEVLLSIILLFIILTSFIGFFTQSALFNQKNDQKLKTIQITQKINNLIEENLTKQILRGDNIIDASGNVIGGTHTLTNADIERYTSQPIDPGYLVTAELRNNTSENLIQIKINVQNSKESGSKTETFSFVRR